MAFPSFCSSAWMKPCVRSTPMAFHFMAIAMDMQHHTPDRCGTGLNSSVKSTLSFDTCRPCTMRHTLSLLTFSLCRVSLDLIMEAGGDDPRAQPTLSLRHHCKLGGGSASIPGTSLVRLW